jgi:hypothetical protein
MIPLGGIGGWAIGSLILIFGIVTGHSGNTDQSGLLVGIVSSLGIMMFYGFPFGLVLLPIGYAIFLRKTRLWPALWLTAGITLLGGCIGALIAPIQASEFGFVGFVVGCIAARIFLPEQPDVSGDLLT